MTGFWWVFYFYEFGVPDQITFTDAGLY